nr:hypothetical protein [Tanacetum cinerariifolium]
MLESKAYKTYYAFASREKPPKPKYIQKKADSVTSPKQKPIQATKGTRLKTKAKVAKSDKKKQPTKKPKGNGLAVLSEVALTKAEQLKLATKKTRHNFTVLTQVAQVMELTLSQSKEEDEDDENDYEDKIEGNDDDDANDDESQEGDDTNDDEEEIDSDSTEFDKIKIPVLDQSTIEFYEEEEEEKNNNEETMDEEEDDEVIKELYNAVNVNLENEDTKMTNTDQEEVKTQLPKILPEAVLDFVTLVIEKNVTESLEAAVLKRSSSQPKSTYEAAASLLEYELTMILLHTMEESKSHLRADYKKNLYDALVESYNTDKDIFESYGEVFSLKRSQDDKDKDQDPFAGSDRRTKRMKSSKDAESSKDSRSKERKSSSTSKDASQSQHKHSGKYAHAEEPSHTVDDSGLQQDQEFDTGNNDKQPADKDATKDDWFKKPK